MVIDGISQKEAKRARHSRVRWIVPLLARQSPYLLVMVLQILLLLVFDRFPRRTGPLNLGHGLLDFGRFLALFGPVCLLALCFLRIVHRPRPERPSVALVLESWHYLACRERLANGLPVLLLFGPFMVLFAYLKANIPAVRPFAFDETFSAWDRALFLGRLPHELLLPVFGHPLMILSTNAAYAAWFGLMWIALLACAFMRSATELRTRYLLAFFLVWFLEGNVLALLWSSAGPCYYGLLGLSPDPYAPLLAVLRQAGESVPVWSLATQAHLWQGYLGEADPLGISAMPSLHNAVCVLMALAAWRLDRRLGLVFSLYGLWIFLGSIALAWHYAVDGLVALPVTLLIWAGAGRFAAWWHRGAARAREATEALPA